MMEVPAANPTDNSTVRYITKRTEVAGCLKPLNDVLQSKSTYQPVFVGDFAPSDRRQRYSYIKEVEKGLLISTVFLTYSPGGSAVNHHFIWRVPDSFDVDAAISENPENQQVIDAIKRELPVYHTRAMRRQFVDMYGKLMKGTSPYLLRDIYKELAGDASAACNVVKWTRDYVKRLKMKILTLLLICVRGEQ
jgi:hypothetical protein